MENSVVKAMPESNNICRICIYLLFIPKIQNGEKIDTYDREHFHASKVQHKSVLKKAI